MLRAGLTIIACCATLLISLPSHSRTPANGRQAAQGHKRQRTARIYRGRFAPLLMDATPFKWSPAKKRVVPVLERRGARPRVKPASKPASKPRPKNVYRGRFRPLLMDDAEFQWSDKEGRVVQVSP